MKQRILSAALAVLFCLSLLPGTALAATGVAEVTIDGATKSTVLNLSPVYVGGVQLLLDTNYVNDNNGSVAVSTDDTYNAKVTEDTDGYVLTLNGLNVTGKTNNEQFSYKSSAIYTETDKPLKIVVAGDSTVMGAQTSVHSAGVYALNALTITGNATLTATGGTATGGGTGSYGVFCNAALTIDNAKLNAIGGDGKESSVGVFAGSITINGDNTVVTAVGGNGGWRSCGMGSSNTICLNGGKVDASGLKNAIIMSFDTTTSGKKIKYIIDNNEFTDYNGNDVQNAKSLTITLGDPAPVYYTISFYTNGGTLTGEGVTTDTANTLYTMRYQKGDSMTLPTMVTRQGYTFAGWYTNQQFTGGAHGAIGAGSAMNLVFYAKWDKNVAYVETPGDQPHTSYYTSLSAAISAAQSGDKVGLLENADSANITSGSFTLDLNGKKLNTLTVSDSKNITITDAGWGSGSIDSISVTNGTVGDLLPEGYSFKMGSEWVKADQLVDSTITGVKIYAIPITSVTVSANKTDLTYGYTETATLTAAAVVSSAPNYSEATPSYQWYSVTGEGENRAETPIDGATSASYSFPTGQNAGTYTYVCYATYDKYSVKSANILEISVAKQPVTAPTIDSKQFTGSTLTAEVPENDKYTVTTNTGGVNAGNYTVVLTLSDPTNYKWSDSDEATKTLQFQITKAPGTVTAPTAVSDLVYNGEMQTLITEGTSKTGTVWYKLGENGTYSTVLPQADNAGTYTVYYKVVGDSNHEDVAEATVPVTIGKKSVTITAEDKTAYRGATTPGLTYTVSGLVGEEKLTKAPMLTTNADMNTAGEYTITASDADAGNNYAITYVPGKLTVLRRSSSSSSRPTYPVTAPAKTENGSVTISPTSAKQGSTVTITATPDAGYVLGDLTVTDKNGKEITLTKKSDTQYTFVMPAGQVEVKASFAKENAGQTGFVDVQSGDYFYDAVQWAVGKGVTNGTDATHFSPDAACTRAQIVTFLWRAAGSPELKNAPGFTDVSASSYYAKAVAWAVENGITNGTSETTFSPDATCTRAQGVAFLYRALGQKTGSQAAFTDVPDDSYYADAVDWAAETGVTNGISETLFGSENACTRAQIVTFLYRAYQGK